MRTKSQYALVDGVLYFVERDKSLRIIPPITYREKLFHEAHDGVFEVTSEKIRYVEN